MVRKKVRPQSCRPVVEAFVPNDKTNLAPYGVLHLVSLALLVVRVMPIDWPGLSWPLFRPLIKCGQQSLAVSVPPDCLS